MRFINHICIFQRFNAASTIQHPGKYCIRDINVRSLNRFHSASIINALFESSLLALLRNISSPHYPEMINKILSKLNTKSKMLFRIQTV